MKNPNSLDQIPAWSGREDPYLECGQMEQDEKINNPDRHFGLACTREMVNRRTVELAAKAGRKPHEITRADYAWAKYEVTGESVHEKQSLILDRGWR